MIRQEQPHSGEQSRVSRGLNFLVQLRNHDRVMPQHVDFSPGPGSPMVSDFSHGKTAMILDGPYHVPQILKGPSFRRNPRNLGIARIPPPPTGHCQLHIPTHRSVGNRMPSLLPQPSV